MLIGDSMDSVWLCWSLQVWDLVLLLESQVVSVLKEGFYFANKLIHQLSLPLERKDVGTCALWLLDFNYSNGIHVQLSLKTAQKIQLLKNATTWLLYMSKKELVFGQKIPLVKYMLLGTIQAVRFDLESQSQFVSKGDEGNPTFILDSEELAQGFISGWSRIAGPSSGAVVAPVFQYALLPMMFTCPISFLLLWVVRYHGVFVNWMVRSGSFNAGHFYAISLHSLCFYSDFYACNCC